MPNLRCERLGPFDTDELREELTNLEFEYMMDLAPSKPPSVVRLCECKDEDYEGYHVRLFVGDYEYVVEEGEVVIVDEFTGRKMAGRRSIMSTCTSSRARSLRWSGHLAAARPRW